MRDPIFSVPGGWTVIARCQLRDDGSQEYRSIDATKRLSFRSCLCCVLCCHKATMARDTNGKVDDMVAIGFKSLFEYLCFM